VALRPVAKTSDVPAGEVRVFDVDSKSIALANVDGAFYAVDNVCTHDNGPLGEGYLDDTMIECPRHGAKFDLGTGAVKALPAVRPVNVYPTQVNGDEVLVDVG